MSSFILDYLVYTEQRWLISISVKFHLWIPVPGKMKQAYLNLSLPLNMAIKSGQTAWSSYLKTLKHK